MFGLLGFAIVTIAEVGGLIVWLWQTQAGQPVAGYLALVAGEAVEWSLLAYIIARSPASAPLRMGRVKVALVQSGLTSLSESLLWVGWAFLIPQLGFAVATVLFGVAMHIKHGIDIAVFTSRPLSADFFNTRSLVATALEVGGAAAWYALVFAGYSIVGGIILLLAISAEHLLQFRNAGLIGGNWSSDSALTAQLQDR